MVTWEIRLIDQPPIRVQIEEDRDLVEEYEVVRARAKPRPWRFWERPDPFWQVTPEIIVHHEMVVGVLPRRPKEPRNPIGFL